MTTDTATPITTTDEGAAAPRARTGKRNRAAVVASLLSAGNYRRIMRASGISPQHVARVIRGRKGASLHAAARIAVAAKVTLDELYDYITASPLLDIRGRKTLRDMEKSKLAKIADVKKARAAARKQQRREG